ncbi:MAG: hypothetical protein ACTSX7_02685 [Alphaproteobacteria bacterium]
MIALLAAAIQLAANPLALVGYIGLGVFAQRIRQAIKYGLLWGLALQLFALASGREDILDFDSMPATTALRLSGAVILTLAVFAIARLLRRRRS